MSELDVLERDVEQARAKFAQDLARLRSPATVESFKDNLVAEATHAKDEWVEKAQDSVKDGALRIWDDVKARAAANPAAALAIGAGLAWRLAQKPPVASILVGIGLVSLFRTSPTAPSWTSPDGGGGTLMRKASDFAESAQGFAENAVETAQDKAQTWAAAVSETARDTVDSVKSSIETMKEKAAVAAEAVTTTARETSDQVIGRTNSAIGGASQRLSNVSQQVSELADRSGAAVREASHAVRGVAADTEIRDRVLVGAAALAVAAALGIAYQRQASDA